jgi:hypothetical protein
LGVALAKVTPGLPGDTETITGVGSTTLGGEVTLTNGDLTYTAQSNVLTSDGHGGTMLSLGASGDIDFVGVAPGHLTASQFHIG